MDSSKYIITNKVRDISFKLLHRFYPTKVFLKRFKSDIDTSCFFVVTLMKLICISSGIVLTHSYFGLNSPMLTIAMCSRVSLFFSRIYCLASFTYKKNQINEYFIINLLLILAKFHIHRSKFTHQNPLCIILKKK